MKWIVIALCMVGCCSIQEQEMRAMAEVECPRLLAAVDAAGEGAALSEADKLLVAWCRKEVKP